MKTTESRDPLDQQIDTLLISRPIKPRADFTAQVLSALDDETKIRETQQRGQPLVAATPTEGFAPLLKFALPIAAVAAFALTLFQFNGTSEVKTPDANLTAAEAQEIFLLEDGLNGLSELTSDNFKGQDFLATLDALTFEIES